MEKNATKLPNFYPGVIHVEDADKISIDHFCFYNIDFGPNNTNSKLVSRGVDKKVNNVQPIHIVLIDCTYDCSNYYIAVEYSPNVKNQVLVNCKSNTVKSNPISYLNLGECQGEVTPNPKIISNDNTNQKDKDHKSKVGMIVGIVIAVCVVIVIAIIVAILLVRKKHKKAPAIEDVDLNTQDENVVHNQNPLYDRNAEEDPFKADFR